MADLQRYYSCNSGPGNFCDRCSFPLQIIKIKPEKYEPLWDRKTGEKNYTSVTVCTNTDKIYKYYLFGLIKRLTYACNSVYNYRYFEKKLSPDIDILSEVLNDELRKLTEKL